MNRSIPIQTLLSQLIAQPSLALARRLEENLTAAGYRKLVFGGRINQKASIEAASEGDRGVVERITNAFDASLTAARLMAGIPASDASLTPRRAAQRFLNPRQDTCEWNPSESSINFPMPLIQMWPEDGGKRRFKRFQSNSGLCTLLVRDFSLGIDRNEIRNTILALNSDSKLRTWEAIGQFGHGGSSALAFCESCLVVTKPRASKVAEEFYWTLIFPEPETEASKQSIVLKWFAEEDGLPPIGRLSDYPDLADALPGTSIWHFGYDRGSWAKTAVGTHQDTPVGRLGRLLFSYPLPFRIQGQLARGDSETGSRTVRGAFFRLMDDRGGANRAIEYRTGEKSEQLIVDGSAYGEFSVFAFVLTSSAEVRNYVDQDRPVLLTLHGQNHGEIRRTLLFDTGLTELASSMIVEIRLDGLDADALSEIITNSRETPKNTDALKVLKQRVIELLKNDDELASIERRRQEARARRSSDDLSKRISSFLSAIISDAKALPSVSPGEGSLGGRDPDLDPPSPPSPRPEILAGDPPGLLEFLAEPPLFVAEGTAALVKFASDARPPKYSFHGDNPRCFARVEVADAFSTLVELTGKSDINGRGYGSVTITAHESPSTPITEKTTVGKLVVAIQTTDGRVLEKSLAIGVRPKPEQRRRKPRQSVVPEITFCASADANLEELKEILGEEKISGFGDAYLGRYREELSVADSDCAYWGQKSELGGVSKLIVEINASHPRFKRLLRSAASVEERTRLKESVVRDIILDCYQHCFRLEDVPEIVHDQVVTEPTELVRAAEICLNFDKVLRLLEQEKPRHKS